MAWIEKRYSKRMNRDMWRLKWRDEIGKTRTRVLNTSDQALAELALKQAQRELGGASGDARNIEEAFRDYQQERSLQVRPGTTEVSEHAIRSLLDAWEGTLETELEFEFSTPPTPPTTKAAEGES